MFNTENYQNVPEHLLKSLIDYGKKKRRTGNFLYYVLSNDLKYALATADEQSLNALNDISRFIYHEMPHLCHGSKEKVDQWIK